MEDNIVRSTDVHKAREKAPVPTEEVEPTSSEGAAEVTEKKPPKAKKVVDERNANETVAKAPSGYKFVFFDSGASYTSTSGVRFTADKRLQLVAEDEADHLLSFDNFRIPTILELQEYSKTL